MNREKGKEKERDREIEGLDEILNKKGGLFLDSSCIIDVAVQVGALRL